MSKRILISLLVLVLVVTTLSGCGKSDTEQAKDVLTKFVSALQSTNPEEMKQYMSESAKATMSDEQAVGDDSDMSKAVLARTKFNFVSGELAKDATSGTLSYEVEAVDILGGNLFDLENLDVEKVNAMETTTDPLDIRFVKESDGWKIENATSVVLYAVGMGAFAEMFDTVAPESPSN